jgi:hypothetical protein
MSNGMMNTTELLDSLIVDCDCAVKDLISHGYIGFCAHMVAIVQKLGALKAGYGKDMKNREDTIEALKAEIRRLGGTVEDMPINEFLKGEGTNGGI